MTEDGNHGKRNHKQHKQWNIWWLDTQVPSGFATNSSGGFQCNWVLPTERALFKKYSTPQFHVTKLAEYAKRMGGYPSTSV
jgi:hypothetical protein